MVLARLFCFAQRERRNALKDSVEKSGTTKEVGMPSNQD